MKYPMEYWTGRMSGFILSMTKDSNVNIDIRLTGKKMVEDFEADYEREE